MSEQLSVVMAGGGCRTVWGVGLLEHLGGELPEVSEWAGVSAGAAMSVICASRRVNESFDYFVGLARNNPRNFYPEELFLRRRPVFPHQPMYEGAMHFTLADGGFERLRSSSPVRILLAYFREGRNPWLTSIESFREYNRRKRLGVIHAPESPHPGLGYEVVSTLEAGRAAEVVEWVLTSSATPPVTRLPVRNGRRYIDGGFVENVPLRALSEKARKGKVLVVLSRPTGRPEDLPESPERLYIAPPEPVPVQKWDYASPDKLRRTFDLGRDFARKNRDRILRWLES